MKKNILSFNSIKVYCILVLLILIFCIELFFPSTVRGEKNSNDECVVKEFPHDLYNKKSDAIEEDGSDLKSSNKKEIKVNVNINLNESNEDKSFKKQEKEIKEYPDPPKDVAKNAEDLLWYYLERWINDDYKAMYGSLSDSAKKKYTFKKFYDLYQREQDVNGGLESAKILGELKQRGPYYDVQLELNFRNQNIKPVKVMAILQYTENGYRINDCGLIPVDYKNL